MDLSETLVDRLMGNDDDNIGDQVGKAYYMLIEELSEHYSRYLGGLPEADKVLAHKLHDFDFKDFLQVPLVPRKKPDITTFIHKPAEHLREVLGLLAQVYAVSPGHQDNTYLDTVLDRLKECYRGVTTQQNIMEPAPPAPLPTGLDGTTPAHARYPAPLRPPLVSVADIEQRLVFTKYTQPFRLNNARREWVFGGELYKFEGRHLKQHWAMLFTDLLLFTKINRDRVIFVMEDPVPLGGVCQALFTIKKKPTEFRLIVDTRVLLSGAGSGYLTTPKSLLSTNKNAGYGRGHKKTLVLRAPTLELKATWDNLIQRQLYVCQQQEQHGPLHHHLPAASLTRAASTDGLHTVTPATGRFSRSVGDLSRGGGDNEEEVLLNLGNDPLRGSSSKVRLRSSGEVREELVLNLENEVSHAPPSASMSSATPTDVPASRVTHRPGTALEGELQLVIEDEGHRVSSHRARAVRSSKVRSWGVQKEEELVFNLDDGELQTASHYARSSRVNSALLNHNQQPIPAIVIGRNVKQAVIDNRSILYDEEVFDDIILEDLRTGVQSHFDSKKGKGIGGKVKDKLFPNRHLPKKKKMNRVKKVEKFVDSIMVEDLDNPGRVTPVFVGEADITHGEFEQKRQDLLQSQIKNFVEGEVEVINLDVPSPSTSRLSPVQAELVMFEERRKHDHKKNEKRTGMRLEGIEEESPDRHVNQIEEQHPKTVLSPEEYEDYIGEAVEKDYPELAGGTEAASSNVVQQQDQPVEQQPLLEQEHRQEQPQPNEIQHQPTGPLSGSASMNFMDDHSPTSNGNGDFYHRCVAKYPRDPPRHASGSFSVEANYLLTSQAECRDEICRNTPETSLLNNNESINSFASQFRTSCVASNNCAGDHRNPKRTTSVSSSTSASANESRNNSTSASEPSSMSISTGSVSSNLSNINKNRSNLFLPTSTTSLPEISIEPPTPQAPKPKDGFDRESKIKYDLRVPGYRSMFLTVPGFDDDYDRFLPKYSFDCDDEEHSSSDDDVVHKPRAFASLAGMDESRCLKRYGSSCDIAKFGLTTDEAIYSHEDDLNANFEVSARKSKVGGTGSGPFVARKLAVFEKVAEEEHQKFIEYQEVRKRIFRAPKKSGDYIEKFYSPKVIETIDARACAGSGSLEYYDDEYDNYNDDRSPTPPEIVTPYGGHSSPRLLSKYYSASNVYTSTNSNHPGSLLPSEDHTQTSYNDEDFDVYDYVGDRQHSPVPTSDKTVSRYVSPVPHSTTDEDANYWRSTEYKHISRPQTTSPGPSSPPPGTTKDNLEQRTDEVLELLKKSYSDMVPGEAGPSHGAPSSWHDEEDAEGAVAGYSGYETPEAPNNRSMSPLPDPDPLENMFHMDEYDSQEPTTSCGGGQKRKAAPLPPTPSSGSSVTPASDTKRGGFFGRARREKDKEKKEKEKEKKKEKKKEKDGTTGKRFQLFGGTKKTSEPSSAEEVSATSPRRDKGKRIFFRRGRENFVGGNPRICHESDTQVARMTGESFEQESIDLEGETEVL